MRFGPCGRRDVLDLPVGHVRQTGKHVAQISMGINAAPPAAFSDRVEDGSALARVGIAHEEPVALAHRRGADGVLKEVIVYALKGVIGIRVQIPAGDIAPARSTGGGSGGDK